MLQDDFLASYTTRIRQITLSYNKRISLPDDRKSDCQTSAIANYGGSAMFSQWCTSENHAPLQEMMEDCHGFRPIMYGKHQGVEWSLAIIPASHPESQKEAY